MKYVVIILIFFTGTNLFSQNDKVVNEFKAALLSNDFNKQKVLAPKVKVNYSAALYEYYKLSFEGLPANAILVTNSTDDTFPLKILQLTQSIRKDVEILNMSFLDDQTYVDRINKKYKLKLKTGDRSKNMKILLSAPNQRVFVSTTVSNQYWSGSDQYLIGLTIGKYISDPQKILEAFYLKFQNSKLNQLKWNDNEKKVFRNLLPPLLTLYKYKAGTNREKLKAVIISLGKKVNQEKQVNIILDKYD